jgi:predicted RNA binding protein YcfA (HicA-like mRNA interferase family)
MKLPRDLSGEMLARHLCKLWQYERIHQVGSHIILETRQPTSHRVAVPAHSPLRVGTLNAILASVAKHKGSSKQEILKGI